MPRNDSWSKKSDLHQNISLVYPASCKPEDVLAAQNYNAIRNWLYLDMAVYGVYNNLVWAYLEEHDACQHLHLEMLKH